ncbi:hypothetical protein R3P38DRAFT_1279241 [Favolaschia claudopus]|uniref:Uncharacterized protein n=1 Tax=Favolaschia claudopus TaxID=2862362 RepID=A0AAW0AZ54_9AGAR
MALFSALQWFLEPVHFSIISLLAAIALLATFSAFLSMRRLALIESRAVGKGHDVEAHFEKIPSCMELVSLLQPEVLVAPGVPVHAVSQPSLAPSSVALGSFSPSSCNHRSLALLIATDQ